MKIEFEIDEKETLMLLAVLKRLMGQSNSPEVLKSLSKITDEIEVDLKISDEIFNQLKFRLSDYTNGNPITIDSDMRVYLGMSDNFLTRGGGLEREANGVLLNVFKKNKPDKTPNLISLSSIKKCKTISDVVILIQTNYEN
jgi:hypothetical protein